MGSNSTNSSGSGSRPTTSGGADNLGAGESMTGGPAPREGMQDKRRDAAAVDADDSSPFGLHERATPEANTDPSAGNPEPPQKRKGD